MSPEEKVAQYLLQINAIKLNIENPFTWSSGIKSPIYCDNRKTLSFPEVRSFLCEAFVEKIRTHFPQVELIAGVATGAIAHGVLVANALDLPFVYVRPDAKKHGLENIIEGKLEKNQKVVVVEDLISTGNSCKNVVKLLSENCCKVLGVVAIFTYEFTSASDTFKELSCPLICLSNYTTLIKKAISHGNISPDAVSSLHMWRKEPRKWGL